MRNAIDRALSDWYQSLGNEGSWTGADSRCELLAPFISPGKWVKRARLDFEDKSRMPSHDDLIAHASFGTWRNMIGNPLAVAESKPETANASQVASWEGMRPQDARCAELWKAAIKDAFRNIPATKKERGKLSPRAYIGSRLARVSALRNRVCHCDSLLRVNVEKRYADMLDVVNAVNLELGAWFDKQCGEEITKVLKEKPKQAGANDCCEVEARVEETA